MYFSESWSIDIYHFTMSAERNSGSLMGQSAGHLRPLQLPKHQSLHKHQDNQAFHSTSKLTGAPAEGSHENVRRILAEESSHILSSLSSPRPGRPCSSATSASQPFSVTAAAEWESLSSHARCSDVHDDAVLSQSAEGEQDGDEALFHSWDYEGPSGQHCPGNGQASRAVSEAESSFQAVTSEETAWKWRMQKSRLPAGLSDRDKFLLRAQARAVFTMQAWQAQTEELMKSDSRAAALVS
jgi:hypothetical protein